jgi:hypothetical protein
MEVLYRCSQSELYIAARLGWHSCRQHLAAFSDFKARYTEAYIDAQLLKVEAAANLLTKQARTEASETFHVALRTEAETALAFWQRLKRYIIEAYPADLQTIKLEAAGAPYYTKASQNNWDFLMALLQAGLNFIETHEAELTANENMPAHFLPRFKDLKLNCVSLHQQFLNSSETANIQTQEKITANNDVYTNLMNMFLDGQEIFKKNDAVQKQFIFTDVVYRISGAGTAGIRGNVCHLITGFGIEGVFITIDGSTKTAITDNEGDYEISPLAAGIYSVSFKKEGYETKTIPAHEVKTGTKGKLTIRLNKMED